MGVLSAEGVQSVFHYSPLHYLIFIARTAAILQQVLSKESWIQLHSFSFYIDGT